MTKASSPTVSFIVLSYNYEFLIGITLRSVLDQTVQDFEIVVVDDASTDRSCEVVRGFNDPRIRLIVNEQNLGGAGSYNRAVENARGEFLVNLDADDWIAPDKTAIQLERMRADPRLDILGTQVSMVDLKGERHPAADDLEPFVNTPQDLNLVGTWVMQNSLCRSSTIIRRSTHLRIGLDDPTMVRAPDYELWTRALRMGCRFDVVPLPLTYYRLHSHGVTHADPLGTFLEQCYCLLRNLLPLIETRAAYTVLADAMRWVVEHDQLTELKPAGRYALLAHLFRGSVFEDFRSFREALFTAHDDSILVGEGRRIFAALRLAPEQLLVSQLRWDMSEYTKGVEYWRAEAENWHAEFDYWRGQSDKWMEEEKFYKEKSDAFEVEYRFYLERSENIERDFSNLREEFEQLLDEVKYYQAESKNYQSESQNYRTESEKYFGEAENWRREYKRLDDLLSEAEVKLARAAPMLAGGRRAQLVRLVARGLGFK